MLKAVMVFCHLHTGSSCQRDIHKQTKEVSVEQLPWKTWKMLHFEQPVLCLLSVGLLKHARYISTCCAQHLDYALLF